MRWITALAAALAVIAGDASLGDTQQTDHWSGIPNVQRSIRAHGPFVLKPADQILAEDTIGCPMERDLGTYLRAYAKASDVGDLDEWADRVGCEFFAVNIPIELAIVDRGPETTIVRTAAGNEFFVPTRALRRTAQ
jgi:hypothetical protein